MSARPTVNTAKLEAVRARLAAVRRGDVSLTTEQRASLVSSVARAKNGRMPPKRRREGDAPGDLAAAKRRKRQRSALKRGRGLADGASGRPGKRARAGQVAQRGVKRRADVSLITGAVKRPRPSPPSAFAGTPVESDAGPSRKRGRDDAPDNGGPRAKRPAGVGFTTAAGKVVSFMPKGKRKAALKAKLETGQAKCMVNPATGRAVREGSRTFRRVARQSKAQGGEFLKDVPALKPMKFER